MRVREIMSSPVITTRPDAGFKEVVETLLDNDISGMPVVDSAGDLLGMVTEADLVTKEAYGRRRRRPLGLIAEYLRGHDPQWVRKASALTARQLMTTEPLTVAPDDQAGVAGRALLEHGRKRLPVVEGGKVVGIVARSDLIRSFLRPDDELQADLDRLLGDALRAPEEHRVTGSVKHGIVRLKGSVRWPSDARVLSAAAGGIPGVVDVDVLITAREADPSLSYPLLPPLS